jgi:succinoglycan biosynthesis transport protein ExoP
MKAETVHLRERLEALRRSWVVLVAFALLFSAAGAAYSLTRTPVYEAQSRVFVSPTSAASLSDLSQGATFTQQLVKSYANVVSAPIVLDRVIARLGLHTTADELAKNVRADAPLDTVIVEITADDPSPLRAARIADAASNALRDVASQLTPGTSRLPSSIQVTRIETASVPTDPISPQIPLTVGLALLLGLAVGGIAIAIRERLDIKVRDVADIQSLTDLPIIGTTLRRRRGAPVMLESLEPGDPYAERYKALITKLRFLHQGRGVRSIAITSSVADEGKSTTVADLGEAFANSTRSVAIVDADLRRPTLADRFGIDGAIGLSDLLTGTVTIDQALQPVGRHGLVLIPAGELPPNPTELLESDRMGDLVRALEERFDLVIFDTSPSLPVTDAAVLAQHTGGLLMVSGVGQVTRPRLVNALQDLAQSGVDVLGIIVTMMPNRNGQYSGYAYKAPGPNGAAAHRRIGETDAGTAAVS